MPRHSINIHQIQWQITFLMLRLMDSLGFLPTISRTLIRGCANSSRAISPMTPRGDDSLVSYIASRRAISPTTHVVIGNEAADLDSVACSIVLGQLWDKPEKPTLPIVNIRREELALRRDVVQALELVGVSPSMLSFRDVDASSAGSVTLVDHNAADDISLAAKVNAIIDHHVDDGMFEHASPRTIERVGSCATLVGEIGMQLGTLRASAATLLLGAVLLDCHDMDPAAGKATPRDEAIAVRLKEMAGIDDNGRRALYKQLKRARKDIEGFSAYDLMCKDTKIVRGSKCDVAICSIGMSADDLAERAENGLLESAERFARDWGVKHAVLMLGYTADGDFNRRVLVPGERGELAQGLLERGQEVDVREEGRKHGFYYLSHEKRASRKIILPLVKQLV